MRIRYKPWMPASALAAFVGTIWFLSWWVASRRIRPRRYAKEFSSIHAPDLPFEWRQGGGSDAGLIPTGIRTDAGYGAAMRISQPCLRDCMYLARITRQYDKGTKLQDATRFVPNVGWSGVRGNNSASSISSGWRPPRPDCFTPRLRRTDESAETVIFVRSRCSIVALAVVWAAAESTFLSKPDREDPPKVFRK